MRQNAVVGVRYDATEVAQGVTEVLAYGTAVRVEVVDKLQRNPNSTAVAIRIDPPDDRTHTAGVTGN